MRGSDTRNASHCNGIKQVQKSIEIKQGQDAQKPNLLAVIFETRWARTRRKFTSSESTQGPVDSD